MKTEGGETILYVNQYYEVNLTTGNATSHYYLGDRLVAMTENTTLRFIHQDHMSGTALVTSDNGSVLGGTGYYPYGESRDSQGELGTDKLFTGQRLDEGIGLYYYNARYYDPMIGRFISADTIVPNPANPQEFNRYTYCLNNPLRYVDPSGNQWEYYEWEFAQHCAKKPNPSDYPGEYAVITYSQDLAAWEAGLEYIIEAQASTYSTQIKQANLGVIPWTTALPLITIPEIVIPAVYFAGPVAVGAAGYYGNQWIAENENYDDVEKSILICRGGLAGRFKGKLNSGKNRIAWQKHMDKLIKARESLNDLNVQLNNQKSPKKRDTIKEKIKKTIKEIKGHIKEMKQKWGDSWTVGPSE